MRRNLIQTGSLTRCAAALEESGLGCEDLVEPDIDPGGGEGIQSSSGTSQVRGEGVQFYVFDTEDDADL